MIDYQTITDFSALLYLNGGLKVTESMVLKEEVDL
jgi:hypothetical protein